MTESTTGKLSYIERKLVHQPSVLAVYKFICDYIEEFNFAPTHREIAEGCLLSRGTVVRYLDRLEAIGVLTREATIARSITLLDDKHRL